VPSTKHIYELLAHRQDNLLPDRRSYLGNISGSGQSTRMVHQVKHEYMPPSIIEKGTVAPGFCLSLRRERQWTLMWSSPTCEFAVTKKKILGVWHSDNQPPWRTEDNCVPYDRTVSQRDEEVRLMFEINISACHLLVVDSITGQTHFSCDREGNSLTA
jgi:hypothetical protein